MIYSPEFWSKDAYRAKVKTPFELVASTARALECGRCGFAAARAVGRAHGRAAVPVRASHRLLGQVETWVNTGALLNRLNFALAFAGDHMAGANVDLKPDVRRRMLPETPKWRFLARSIFSSTARSRRARARRSRRG